MVKKNENENRVLSNQQIKSALKKHGFNFYYKQDGKPDYRKTLENVCLELRNI